MRLPFLLLTILPPLLVGCGSPQPPAVTPAVQTGKTADPSDSASQTGKATVTSPVAGSNSVPPAIEKPPATKPAVESTKPTPEASALRKLAAKLVEKTPDGLWRINEAAALEMEKQESSAKAELVTLMHDSDPQVRRGSAYYLLASFNPNDKSQVEAYSALLDDTDANLRTLGLQAVRQMHAADQLSAVPRLTTMLTKETEASADNRASLARFLGSLKAGGQPALDALITAAKEDESPKARGACLVAISQIAPPEEAIPAYRTGLADAEGSVRLVAVARLRQLGAQAIPAARELAQALDDVDPRLGKDIREAAAETLILLGKDAVPYLEKPLAGSSKTAKLLALACLGKIGPAAKEALPLAKKCLTDSDPQVQKLAEAVVRILQSAP